MTLCYEILKMLLLNMEWISVVEQTFEILYLVKGISFMTEIYQHKYLYVFFSNLIKVER